MKIILFFLFFSMFSILRAVDSLEILHLEPEIFGKQLIHFDTTQPPVILQEHFLTATRMNPTDHGLMLSNLNSLDLALSTVKTESLTLFASMFQSKPPDGLTTEHILLIEGFFHLKSVKQPIAGFKEWEKKARKNDTGPWLKLILARILDQLAGEDKSGGHSLVLLGSASAHADAFYHYCSGSYFLETTLQFPPAKRLRLITMEFEKARAKDPRNRPLFSKITSIYLQLHEEFQTKGIPQPFEFEELVYRRVIMMEPKNPWVHNNLAFLYCENNVEIPEGIREARIANHLEKDNPQFLDTLGWCHYKAGQFKEADAILHRALSLDASLPDLHFHLASLYYDQKKLDQAVKSFEKVIQIDPDSALAKNNLAYLYSEMGIELDKAKDLVSAALEASPDNPAYLDTLGWIYYKMSKFDLALPILEQALRIDPASEETKLHIRLTRQAMGFSVQDPASTAPQESQAPTKANAIPPASHKSPALFLKKTIENSLLDYKKTHPDYKKEELKVFYDQMISLAQSQSDSDEAIRLLEEYKNLNLSVSKNQGKTETLPDVLRFFPKEPVLFFEMDRDGLFFLLQQVYDSNLFPLENQDILTSVHANLPSFVGFHISRPKNMKTEIYAVMELREDQITTIEEHLELLTQGLLLPAASLPAAFDRIQDNTFHIQIAGISLFLQIKENFIIISNTAKRVHQLPYKQDESLQASTYLKTLPLHQAGLYVEDFANLLDMFEHLEILEDFKKKIHEEVSFIKDFQSYHSILFVSDNTMKEIETIQIRPEANYSSILEKMQIQRENLKKFSDSLNIELIQDEQKREIRVETLVSEVESLTKTVMEWIKRLGIIPEKYLQLKEGNHEQQK